MTVWEIILAAGFGVSAAACIVLFLRTVLMGEEYDPSVPKGRTFPAVLYSYTGAMSPFKKETANRHWLTYTAGILYHGGIFFSFFWLLIRMLPVDPPDSVFMPSFCILCITSISGMAILVKRMSSRKMRSLSNPDDYLSNIMATGFQIITAASLLSLAGQSLVYTYSAVLFIYIPVGKLRHAVFFPLTRIYLGLHYGRRGVWPPARSDT